MEKQMNNYYSDIFNQTKLIEKHLIGSIDSNLNKMNESEKYMNRHYRLQCLTQNEIDIFNKYKTKN